MGTRCSCRFAADVQALLWDMVQDTITEASFHCAEAFCAPDFAAAEPSHGPGGRLDSERRYQEIRIQLRNQRRRTYAQPRYG
jgi:hypothetical protein